MVRYTCGGGVVRCVICGSGVPPGQWRITTCGREQQGGVAQKRPGHGIQVYHHHTTTTIEEAKRVRKEDEALYKACLKEEQRREKVSSIRSWKKSETAKRKRQEKREEKTNGAPGKTSRPLASNSNSEEEMSETDSLNNFIDDEEAADKDESYKDEEEEEEEEEEDPASALNWVCCDECERWRIVGKPVNDAEGWVCRSHDRDCSEPEDVDQVLAIPVPSAGELTTDQKARAAANRLRALELQKLALTRISR